MSSKPIYLDNSYEYAFTVRRKNTATGVLEPVTGLVDLKGLVSQTPGGSTINAAIELALAERASKPGDYFGILSTSLVNTHLTSFADQMVHVCARNADVEVSEPVPVYAVRPLG